MTPTDSEVRGAVLARCTYNPRAGELLRRPGRGVKAGTRIGSADSQGKLQATITVGTGTGVAVRCYVDHLVWLLHYGKFPKALIHVDGDPANNHIDNLRERPKRMRTNGKGWKCCLTHGIELGRLGKSCTKCPVTPETRKKMSEAALKRLGPKQYGLFKTCSKCKHAKGIEEFPKSKEKGRHAYCKQCTARFTRARYREDPERQARARKSWEARNPHKTAEYSRIHGAKRKAAKDQRTPSWSDLERVAEIYRKCPPGMEVDHVVPLRGRSVSGLHVPENLQYLTKSENSSKCNRYTPRIETFDEQKDQNPHPR